MPDLVERYHDAVNRLDNLISATPSRTDTSREAVRLRAQERMGRLRAFVAFLGAPAASVPLIHVGGTSGKGSTTTALAAILTAAGYRTGVHTSPYLQAPSEKLQLNGDLIEAERFIRLTDQLLSALDDFPAADHITYGEAWIALVMLFLEDTGADVGVIEVGAGGRFDLTNIIDPTLSVITSVGIDHTNTLGETIEEIAWHKAGIIKPGRLALSGVQDPAARAFMEAEAEEVGATLHQIDLETAIADIRTSESETAWREAVSGEMWSMGMAGRFQARNGQLAVSAARLLAANGWSIGADAIDRGLREARIPGRAETMPGTPRVMLDGAHNAQKVAAIAEDLPSLLPRPEGARRIVILGALEAKHMDESIRSLLPHADVLVATSPQVLAKTSKSAAELARAAREAGFGDQVIEEPDPVAAMERARQLASADRGDAILVTGSLYLVGNIRERWYETDRIIAQHTPWPMNSDAPPRTTVAGARAPSS